MYDKVLINPHPSLYSPTTDFSKIDTADINRINRLAEIMKLAGGCGISANQCGWGKSVFIYQDEEDKEIKVIINPHVVWHSADKEEGCESCLSLPGKTLIVPRWTAIEIKHGVDGKERLLRNGMSARILQHEEGHVNGVLISDIAVSEVSLVEQTPIL